MKKRLSVLLAIFSVGWMALTPCPAQANEEALLEAFGTSSAQGVLLTYMAVCTLGDGYVAKAFTKKQAAELVASYAGIVEAITKSIKELPSKHKFSDEDKKYIQGLSEAYDDLENQITALSAFIEKGDDASAKTFEKNRLKAKTKIDQLFK